MTEGMKNVEVAEENEVFADDILEGFDNKNNWVVTVRFYSLVHYIEERLTTYDYNSRSHDNREENILDCRYIDNKVRKLYRRLYDVSRDARYECVRLGEEDVRKSEETLAEAKEILGFTDGTSDHKYSI